MKKTGPSLDWCIVRIGEDKNWWIDSISDNENWDVDNLGIIDPKQFLHINELLDSMTEFGLDSQIVDEAFFTFAIEEELKGGLIKLVRVRDSLLKAEDMLFALPDVLDEEKGPYADFLNQVSGEYSRLWASHLNGWLDLDSCALESLYSIKRAGADIIFTYFAERIASKI